jgi:DNA-binding MarR family transcriptional regulator
MVDWRQLFRNPDAVSPTPPDADPSGRPDSTPGSNRFGGASDRDLDAVMLGSRVVTAVVAGSLARTGWTVTVPQLRVLVLAATRPGTSATDIAEALAVHLSSASRTVDRLVAAGLLDRRESAEDRRRLDLTPTSEGTRLLHEVMADRRRELRVYLDRMSPADRDHLARGMAALASVADETPGRAPFLF